ncbi:hypothetical protein FOA52_016091 [Chlamydomonas sp. UWO 241]|nr:hypothetical protein FOA52_016091 [Chlamydomonas sp. UWO 241]
MSRRPAVVVRAGWVQDIAAAVTRVFTPTSMGNKDDWENTGSGFTGKIVHHNEPGSRKPFRDQWSAGPHAPRTPDAVAAGQPAETETVAEGKGEGAAEYIGGAAKRMVNNNFTGDGTEPAEEWAKDPAGFSKSTRTRDKDGFHSTTQ